MVKYSFQLENEVKRFDVGITDFALSEDDNSVNAG
jgi:hypothetical protein